jgi:ADP-ribosylglycohydrolase
MSEARIDPNRIRGAWEGRISGCQLGKPVELISILAGRDALIEYLKEAEAYPLRDYVPLIENSPVDSVITRRSCKEYLQRSEPDDDINYSVLALMLLEEHGMHLTTADVARAWLRWLPGGATFTAERAAYRTLLERAADGFAYGADPGFDLMECAENEWSEWIGAQIRADLYGWVCPGRPELAADLARRDASLSHMGEGVHGAAFIAALGAAIPSSKSILEAVEVASKVVPKDSGAAEAISLAQSLVGRPDAVEQLHEKYKDLHPVHVLNNLALGVWGLLSYEHDFSAAIGEAVSAGWDTDCNGATVGGLWGLQGKPIPSHWTQPWQGRVAVTIAEVGELVIGDLVDRTIAVAEKLVGDAESARP